MKKISIVVPTYNEEVNVVDLTQCLLDCVMNKLSNYDYEIIFIDNCSKDNTRNLLENLCSQNKNIKAIFNIRNFGQFNSPFYGLQQATGDCVILICADFQDPIDLIPEFVKEWENGYQIVSGIKVSSKESHFMYFLRGLYYKMIKKMSNVDQIEQFTGFGLYDRSFIHVLQNIHDPQPFLRGLVAEFGGKRKEIKYEQAKRKGGKTSNNWYTLYDAAMLSFTTYTKVGLRIATFLGFFIAVINFFIALIYLILKLIYWDRFAAGMVPMILVILFIGAIQLIFIGILGEYILTINNRVLQRPIVIEEKRINF